MGIESDSSGTSYDMLSDKARSEITSLYEDYHKVKNEELSSLALKKLAEIIADRDNLTVQKGNTEEKLTDDIQEAVHNQQKIFYKGRALKPLAIEIFYKEKQFDSKTLIKNRNYFTSLYDSCDATISHFNPAIIPYLSEDAKQEKINFFTFAWRICYGKHQIDLIEARGHAFKSNRGNIRQCMAFIDLLKASLEKDKKQEQLIKATLPSCSASDRAIALAAAQDAAKLIGNTMIGIANEVETPDSKTDKANSNTGQASQPSDESGMKGKVSGILHRTMCAINERRLYWVWGGSMLSAILATIPQTFYNVANTSYAINTALPPYTGTLSYALYYARGFLSLYLLLKHTIAHPWMSDEERTIPWNQRFLAQWNQRKFSLLNDFIWATANLACFFWLTSAKGLMRGYAGDLLTVGLLLMDLCLTIWRFREQIAKHEAEMAFFNADRVILKKKLKTLKNELVKTPEMEVTEDDIASLRAEITDIEKRQLPELDKRQNAARLEWAYKKYGLINDLAYAASLVLAFSMMCCLFCPPTLIAPGVAMIIAIAGGALCFIMGLTYAAISSGIEMAKTNRKSRDARAQCQALLNQYADDMKHGRLAKDTLKAKELYLEMKGLRAEAGHQKKMIIYQGVELVRSLIIDVCIPVVVFASLTFLPFGIGLGILAAGLTVAFLSRLMMRALAPENLTPVKFDDEEFDHFEKALFTRDQSKKDVPLEVLDNRKVKRNSFGLFARGTQPTKTKTKDNDDNLASNPNFVTI